MRVSCSGLPSSERSLHASPWKKWTFQGGVGDKSWLRSPALSANCSGRGTSVVWSGWRGAAHMAPSVAVQAIQSLGLSVPPRWRHSKDSAQREWNEIKIQVCVKEVNYIHKRKKNCLYLQISLFYFFLSSGFFCGSRQQPSNPCVWLHQTVGEREREGERELHHPQKERGGEEEEGERMREREREGAGCLQSRYETSTVESQVFIVSSVCINFLFFMSIINFIRTFPFH